MILCVAFLNGKNGKCCVGLPPRTESGSILVECRHQTLPATAPSGSAFSRHSDSISEASCAMTEQGRRMRRDAPGRMLTWAQTPERGSLCTSWCTVEDTRDIAKDPELWEVGEESDQD